ncbi:Carboxylesterase patB [Phytophthora ramorum]|uniref:Carboxylesterase type B domain-containing protein n=1 Tax=Phytophthora ramorum TaxID=164328 RepID=H3H292_PHYRM|nr:Carboxylesterase patB [Phytophthora ramorum]
MRVYALLTISAAVVTSVMAGNSTYALSTVQSVDDGTASSQATTSSSSLPTVELDYTTVQAVGGNTTVGYYKYQNIRFAKVPTGDLRFAAPEWPEVEAEINAGNLADADVECKTSEDCLYLDVWAPADAVGRNLPVLVWTYGGGFTGGSKSQNTPEGLFDLTQDFVFVAYNYRVGITGLTNGPTYQHEGGVSNLCVWDSTRAFEWVQKYISKFGGSPDDVTAAGFSAGGSQVLFQMTRFGGNAPQLFHKAYVMSPGYVPGAGHHHGEQFWQNVSSAVGCEGGHLDCMRQVDFTNLTDATNDAVDEYTYQMQPRVDGFIVPDTYEANLYQGHFNFSGPCVISHEQHEANSQAYSGVDSQEDVSTYLRIFFPAITDDVVEELLELYPEGDYESAGLRFADMKQSFDLTGKNLALTHALKNQTWNAEVALGEATHGVDQNYYWYSTYSLSTTSSSTAASTMSAGEAASVGAVTTTVNATIAVAMQKYLMSFVLTGNPNSVWPEDKLYWPQYNESSVGTQIVLNDTFTVAADDLANSKSLFWNKALWY